MINLYRAAINGDSGTTAQLRTLGPLLAQHEQHLAQLRARLVRPGAPATPSPTTRPAASAGGGSASTGPARVTTARLRTAERASAAA